MSVTVMQSVTRRFKISDPRPPYCSSCAQGARADVVFYDLSAAFDAGAFAQGQELTFFAGLDDLHLCEGCVRELCELAGFKPEMHRQQYLEIQRLLARIEFLEGSLKRLGEELHLQIHTNLAPAPPAPEQSQPSGPWKVVGGPEPPRRRGRSPKPQQED